MSALLAAVFVASLVGSLHCAGMCGGIVALCVAGVPVRRRDRWAAPAAYNLGRLATYATLGAASGGVGAAIDLGGSDLGLPRLTALIAGIAMIVFGVAALLRTRGLRFGGSAVPAVLHRALRRGTQAANALPPVPRAAALGLLTGFLPCGWLYAFVITAAGTGSPWLGALTMVAFWAGTVPVLVALGAGLQVLAAPLRRHVPTMTAIVLIAIGVVAIAGRVNVPAYAGALNDAAADTPGAPGEVERVESLDAASMPCCEDGPDEP
jgi:sulfite exporter TauE/SafE